jgi:hypothetical protein|tara:strand:- start:187 stop:426 length:240 start_codon:yes stop_codon:yes gene_type:complete
MSQPITITVTRAFSSDDKKIGLDDYVSEWTYGLEMIWRLGETAEEMEELNEMKERVKNLAVKRFFSLYESEQLEKKEAA